MTNLVVAGVTPANVDVAIENTRPCGEDIAQGDLLDINAQARYVKHVANGTNRPRAIAPRACRSGENLTGHREGVFGGFTGLVPGAPLYDSATAGRIQDAQASGARYIGYAKTATSAYFNFAVAAIATPLA